jgi:hypothetical protein
MDKYSLPLRGILGLYTIECAEDSAFDPTIWQHYLRLRSDFYMLCPPPPPLMEASNAEELEAQPAHLDDVCRRSAFEYGNMVIKQVGENRSNVTNAHLYTLESAILALSSLEALKQGYQSLQNRYRALAGAEIYKEYLIGQRPMGVQRAAISSGDAQNNLQGPAAPLNNDIDIYRADSLFLIREIRRYSILAPRREQIRRWLLIDVLAVVLSVVTGLALSIAFSNEHYFPLMRLVSIVALLGGLTSVLQRIQTIPEDQLSLTLWNRISVVLSPLTAIVFALVLYEVFEATFVTGAFFPSIARLYRAPDGVSLCHPSTDCHRLYELFSTVSHVEFAKLMVWSFIAGFSERFVPDTLNGLIARQKTATSK